MREAQSRASREEITDIVGGVRRSWWSQGEGVRRMGAALGVGCMRGRKER